MALGSVHSRFQDPMGAMHLILFHYNSREWVMLPFNFFVRKFLQLPVQVPMGFLTRPVTADHTQNNPGYDEYRDDHEDHFHHASVPFMCPRYSAIATAEMNMPVMIDTKSI